MPISGYENMNNHCLCLVFHMSLCGDVLIAKPWNRSCGLGASAVHDLLFESQLMPVPRSAAFLYPEIAKNNVFMYCFKSVKCHLNQNLPEKL